MHTRWNRSNTSTQNVRSWNQLSDFQFLDRLRMLLLTECNPSSTSVGGPRNLHGVAAGPRHVPMCTSRCPCTPQSASIVAWSGAVFDWHPSIFTDLFDKVWISSGFLIIYSNLIDSGRQWRESRKRGRRKSQFENYMQIFCSSRHMPIFAKLPF